MTHGLFPQRHRYPEPYWALFQTALRAGFLLTFTLLLLLVLACLVMVGSY